RLSPRRRRPVRYADAGAVAGVLGLPLSPGSARRRRRQAVEGAARLPAPVHERLPAVTGPPTGAGAGSAGRTVVGTAGRRLGPAIALVGAILVAWELYARLSGLSPFALPPPSPVGTALRGLRAHALRPATPTSAQ